MHVPISPVMPRKRHGRVAVLAIALVALFTPTFSFIPHPGQTVDAYTWSAWTTKYYTASANDCKASKMLADRFVGPIPYYSTQCVYRVRSRYAIVNDWAGWTDRLIQIDNVAPYWSEAWGMRLQVRVHWNGTVARYAPETLLCTKWAFLIKVTQTDCKVFGDNTATVTARMGYEASYSYLFVSAAVDRGAQIAVTKTGSIGPVVKWP